MNRNKNSANNRFTWYCTNTGLHSFLKFGFVVAGGWFYSYYIHQGNKLDKERKIASKKLSLMNTKRFNTSYKKRMQFRVGANSTSTQLNNKLRRKAIPFPKF